MLLPILAVVAILNGSQSLTRRPFLAVLSFLSSPSLPHCLYLAVLSSPSLPRRPFLAVLSFLSSPSFPHCPFLPFLAVLSSPSLPRRPFLPSLAIISFLAVLSSLTFPSFPFFAHEPRATGSFNQSSSCRDTMAPYDEI